MAKAMTAWIIKSNYWAARCRYNPSIVRVGVGQSDFVKDVSLESKVNEIIAEMEDPGKVQGAIAAFRSELTRLQGEIHSLRSWLMVILEPVTIHSLQNGKFAAMMLDRYISLIIWRDVQHMTPTTWTRWELSLSEISTWIQHVYVAACQVGW